MLQRQSLSTKNTHLVSPPGNLILSIINKILLSEIAAPSMSICQMIFSQISLQGKNMDYHPTPLPLNNQ